MNNKFTEAALEQAIIELILKQGIEHIVGGKINRELNDVLIKDDLRQFLKTQYADANITAAEIASIIRQLEGKSAADLYASNKAVMKMVSDGFLLKREDRNQKDLFIQLLDYSGLADFIENTKHLETVVAENNATYGANNIYKIVNQMEIVGFEKRIPDAILYINGLPLVVFEFKSAIREQATIFDAYTQLTTRYKRDIPELFKYNAFCVISDGVNNKMGSFFAPYEFFYAWRKVAADEKLEQQGIDSLFTLIQGAFNKGRLLDIIRNFIYFPDSGKTDEKILCRYPQYYAANKLYQNILQHRKPAGDGKGGTYFGATGCGKSFTMLFLARLLMRSVKFSSPTLVLITDRADLDNQLSVQFTAAKGYIGDENIISVASRADLRGHLKGRDSGGVFLTTIHKFTEDTQLLTNRSNVICISDEAHRSQVNLDQKVKVTTDGVKRSYGFAKYLHSSLPNATFVGFTGTPIDATLAVFGDVVDAYTMTESVIDEITVGIVYEGRAAKVLLDNGKLAEIEDYYNQCAEAGASDYAIEASKQTTAQMNTILGDPDRIKALAKDFIAHYETRVTEAATVKGKAMFVCSSRAIAYSLYKAIIALRPEWAETKLVATDTELSAKKRKEIKSIEHIKMIMTRNKDDEQQLYKMLGDDSYRKELDRQFKDGKSNLKIAIVVDMWLTGFDVPFLDTIYIDKPIKQHNLIQTISRVNRKYAGKAKGLVVDYIGIKRQMNLALAHYSKTDGQNIEDIKQSVIAVKNQLDLLNKIFYKFDKSLYFTGSSLQQLECLKLAAEFAQITQDIERRFMELVKRLKAAYNICCNNDAISQVESDNIHFYFAVRSIIYKLTKGNAPDTAQMNARVCEMITDALQSDGVEEIFKIGDDSQKLIDIFDDDYLAKIAKIKLPNTKIKLLQQLLAKAIEDFKKINKIRGTDFSEKFKLLVSKYNDRTEPDVLRSEVLEDFSSEIIDLIHSLKNERNSFC